VGHSSDFLFVTPSFIRGVASIADFWGVLAEYNRSPTPEYADALAVFMDWRVTGLDLAEAMQKLSPTIIEAASKAAAASLRR
jgi:hypothetical protein